MAPSKPVYAWHQLVQCVRGRVPRSFVDLDFPPGGYGPEYRPTRSAADRTIQAWLLSGAQPVVLLLAEHPPARRSRCAARPRRTVSSVAAFAALGRLWWSRHARAVDYPDQR